MPLERTILPAPAEQDLPPALLARAGRAEEIRLVDPEGGPAVGSWVRLESTLENEERRRWMQETGWRRLAVSGWTDANGGLRFLRAPDETLTFVADNVWGRARVGVGPRSTGGVQQRPWQEVARVRLRSLDQAGRPHADAVVEVDGRPAGRANTLGVVEVSARQSARIRARSASGAELETRLEGDGWETARKDLHAMKLAPRAQLRVSVVDHDSGKGVAGAFVVVAETTHVAGASGDVQIGVTASSSVLVGAYGYRWASLSSDHVADLLASPESDEVTVTLRPASSMTGRVADTAGGPLGGVELRLASDVHPPPGTVGESEQIAVSFARTRADGTFRVLDLVPAMGYVLEARLAGYSDLDHELRSPPAGQRLDSVLLEMLRPRPVFGWVVDGENDDRPVADAQVQIFGHPQPDPVRTDVRGRFEVEHFGGSVASVLVEADGYAPTHIEGVLLSAPREDPSPFELGTIVLDTGSELEVLVSDADGEPIKGALVEIDGRFYRMTRARRSGGIVLRQSSQSVGRARGSWAVSDDDGWARLAHLPTSELLAVRSRASGYVVTELEGIALPRDEPVEIVMEPASSIAGRVRDVSGTPIENAHVSIHPLDVLKKQPPGLHIRTDQRGEFVIAGVPAGRHRVLARAVDHAEIDPVEVDLSSGEPVEELEIVVPPSARLSGRVVNGDGLPLPGARVLCASRLGVTDERGEFSIDHVRLGPQRVEVRASGRSPQFRQLVIEPAGAWLEVELGRGVSVSGRVEDGSGRPVAAVMYLRPTQSGASARVDSQSDGSFVFPDVAAGTYRLTAQTRDNRAASVDVEVAERSVTGVELRVGGLATVRGSVLGLDSEAMTRVRVGMRTEQASIFATVDWEGRFVIDHVPEGEWTVVGSLELAGGRWTAETEVIVDAKTQDVVADLEFERVGHEAALSGRVLIEGRPASAWLLLGNQENYWNTTANSVGEFQFPAVGPGRYDLTVAARDTSLTHARQIEVRGDEHVTLRLSRATVNGQVADSSGKPIEGAVLQVLGRNEPLGQRYTRHRSGQDGTFSIAVLLEEPMRLIVSRPGYSPWEGRIDAGEQFADVVLEGTGVPVVSTRQP